MSSWGTWLTDQVADATGVDVSGVVAGVSDVSEQLSGAIASVSGDLQEFVDTVQTDTSETVSEIQSAIEEGAASDQGITLSTVSGAMDSIVGSISAGLREDGTATDRGRRNKGQGDADGPITYDRAEAQLRAVQRNRKTYLNEPEGDQDAYHAWCDQFDLHACTEEISQLLSTDEMVQKLHAELIPGKVSYNLFWHRYFYAVHGLKVAEDKRLALVQRLGANANDDEDEDLDFGDWDDDGDGGGKGEEKGAEGAEGAEEAADIDTKAAGAAAESTADDRGGTTSEIHEAEAETDADTDADAARGEIQADAAPKVHATEAVPKVDAKGEPAADNSSLTPSLPVEKGDEAKPAVAPELKPEPAAEAAAAAAAEPGKAGASVQPPPTGADNSDGPAEDEASPTPSEEPVVVTAADATPEGGGDGEDWDDWE